MTTQPIAGNQFFSSVVNKAPQLPHLNATNIKAAEISSSNLSVTGTTMGCNVMSTLANQTVTTKGTAASVTYVAGINVNDFTGAANQVTTLPAAVAGVVCIHAQSVDTTGGFGIINWKCAGTDTIAAGQVVESRAASSGPAVFNTSVLGDTQLNLLVHNAATNLMSIGSYVTFTCVTTGEWCVSQRLQHLGSRSKRSYHSEW